MATQKQMTEQELDQLAGGIILIMDHKRQGNSTHWSEICDVGASFRQGPAKTTNGLVEEPWSQRTR